MSQLVTGEAVVLQVRLARMPSRALAASLDALLQALVLGVLISVLLAFLSDANEALAAGVVVLTLVLVLIGYRLTMETLTRGQTLGKMAVGLRVVRDDGSAIRFRQALVRTLLWIFVDFAPWFACCPGIVSSLMNKQGKRIGDMLAGTVVIRERHQAVQSPPLFVPGHLVAWAGSLELSRLTDDLANTAREYLARYTELEPAAREYLGNTLAGRVSELTAPVPPVPISAPAYLSAILAERRRRELARLATAQPSLGVYAPHNPGSYGPAGPFAPSPYGPNPSAPQPGQYAPPPAGQYAPPPPSQHPQQYGIPPEYRPQPYGLPPAGQTPPQPRPQDDVRRDEPRTDPWIPPGESGRP